MTLAGARAWTLCVAIASLLAAACGPAAPTNANASASAEAPSQGGGFAPARSSQVTTPISQVLTLDDCARAGSAGDLGVQRPAGRERSAKLAVDGPRVLRGGRVPCVWRCQLKMLKTCRSSQCSSSTRTTTR